MILVVIPTQSVWRATFLSHRALHVARTGAAHREQGCSEEGAGLATVRSSILHCRQNRNLQRLPRRQRRQQ